MTANNCSTIEPPGNGCIASLAGMRQPNAGWFYCGYASPSPVITKSFSSLWHSLFQWKGKNSSQCVNLDAESSPRIVRTILQQSSKELMVLDLPDPIFDWCFDTFVFLPWHILATRCNKQAWRTPGSESTPESLRRTRRRAPSVEMSVSSTSYRSAAL